MKRGVVGLSLLVMLALVLLFFFFMDRRNKEVFIEIPPRNGIIFQSGGFVSSWYAYVVDFDSLIITQYQGANKTLVTKKGLKQDEVDQILEFSKKAIEEDKTNFPDITADVDFRLDLSIDNNIKTTQTLGPLPDEGAIRSLFDLLNSVNPVTILGKNIYEM